MKRRYIGEKKPLMYRIKELPYYSLRCPAEAGQMRKKRTLLSKIVWGGSKEDEQQLRGCENGWNGQFV